MAPSGTPRTSSRKRLRVDSSPEPEHLATQARIAPAHATTRSLSVKQDPENTPAINLREAEAQPREEKCCESLWFDDGNVVIQCRGVAFRVHRSLLSRESEMLLEMPQEEVVRAEYGGCTVLSIEEDYPSDVEHFLHAIYEEKRVFNRDQPLDMRAALAMLNLGRKYDATAIREEAQQRVINSAFSIISRSPEVHEKTAARHAASAVEWRQVDAIPLTRLAYAHRDVLGDILPIALYACCQLSSEDLVDGFKFEGRSLEAERLGPELLKKVLNARRNLVDKSKAILNDIPAAGNPSCACTFLLAGDKTPRSRCWEGAKGARAVSPKLKARHATWHPALKLEMWRAHWANKALCSKCLSWFDTTFERMSRELVEDLPKLLGIQEWIAGEGERAIEAEHNS